MSAVGAGGADDNHGAALAAVFVGRHCREVSEMYVSSSSRVVESGLGELEW